MRVRHKDNGAARKSLLDAPGTDLNYGRGAVGGVRNDSCLRAGERDRLLAQVVDGHRAQRNRDPGACRDEHVVFPRRGLLGDRGRKTDQLRGRILGGRKDADDPIARATRVHQLACHRAYSLGVRNRSTRKAQHENGRVRGFVARRGERLGCAKGHAPTLGGEKRCGNLLHTRPSE